MLLAVALVLGLGLGLVLRGRVSALAHVQLRFEGVLVTTLFVQLALPALHVSGATARLAFGTWLAGLAIASAVAFANRRHAGMLLVSAGLAGNVLVIALNCGMPVDLTVARALGAASMSIPPGDFTHVAVTAATRLPLLADVLPIPGPPGFRLLASPGDLLLAVGAATFMAISMSASRRRTLT